MNKFNFQTKIKTLWAKIKASRDYDSNQVAANPFRDWHRLLSWWLVFLLLILGAAAYLSWRINTFKVTLSPGEAVATVEISSKPVTQAKKLIEDRAFRFEQNRRTPPILIDPGL